MAAVLYGKEHLQVEPVAVPDIESGDILVRVKAALTCGTDVKVFRRGYHARMIVPPALFRPRAGGRRRRGRRGCDAVSRRASAWWRRIPRPATSATSASAAMRESLRGPAVQQRRVRRVHPHSGAHRGAEHVRHSRRMSAIRMPRWSSRWPAWCAASKRPGSGRATPSR